jgi:ketosteroid isomerase-like protein
MINESKKAIVIRFVKAINGHNINELVNLMSENHIFIDATGNKTVGKNEMKEGWKGYYEIFPDYQIEISDIIDTDSIIGLFGYIVTILFCLK